MPSFAFFVPPRTKLNFHKQRVFHLQSSEGWILEEQGKAVSFYGLLIAAFFFMFTCCGWVAYLFLRGSNTQ